MNKKEQVHIQVVNRNKFTNGSMRPRFQFEGEEQVVKVSPRNVGKNAAAIAEIAAGIFDLENISRYQAKQLLKLGVVMTHRHFTPEENIRQVGINMVMEDGAKIGCDIFWNDRVGEGFDDGWGIFKETEK